MTERNLADDDFPLVIKICLKDKETLKKESLAIKFGFQDKKAYFLGQFNESDKSLQGWAETTSNGTMVTSAVKVLNQVAFKVEEVVSKIFMKDAKANSSAPWEPLPLDLVTTERPTFPRFCFTLNVTRAEKLKMARLKMLKMTFTGIQDLQFILHGRELYTRRNIREQNVYSSGEALKLEKNDSLEYLVQIKESIFVEEDQTKSCKIYPDAKFASYDQCDEIFLKEQVELVF